MKNKFLFILVICLAFASYCFGQSKQTINFLDEKYQKQNGYVLNDDFGDLYPSFLFFDKNIGLFSVEFIPKNEKILSFWNDEFLKKCEIPENCAKDSEGIRRNINKNFENYYIVANFLDKKYIENVDSSGEITLQKNARLIFYLWKNVKWTFLYEESNLQFAENLKQYGNRYNFYKEHILKEVK